MKEIQFNLATEDMNKRFFHELEFQCMTMLLLQLNFANYNKEIYDELNIREEAKNFNSIITQQHHHNNS